MAGRHQHQSCSVGLGISAGGPMANGGGSRAPPGQDREELVPTQVRGAMGGQGRAQGALGH